MNQKLAAVAALGLATTIVGYSVYDYVKTRKQEKANREKIETNLAIDLEAIRLAGARIDAMLRDRSIPLKASWEYDRLFNEEYEFQKIALRIK